MTLASRAADAAHPGRSPAAIREQALDSEIAELDDELGQLVAHAAPPGLLALHGVGTDVAATVMIATGNNPERMRSEAAFAPCAGLRPFPPAPGAPNATA